MEFFFILIVGIVMGSKVRLLGSKVSCFLFIELKVVFDISNKCFLLLFKSFR